MNSIILFASLLFSGAQASPLVEGVIVLSQSDEESPDASALLPIGRAISNKKTGETIEFVCMDEFDTKNPCRRLRLRKNGNELLGLQLNVYRSPEEAMREQVRSNVVSFYENRRWKYRILPLGDLMWTGPSPNVGERALADLTASFAGAVVGGIVHLAVKSLSVYGWIAAPWAIEGIWMSSNVAAGVQRTVNRIQQGKAKRRLSSAVSMMFDLERINQDPYRLGHRDFELFKMALSYLVGAQSKNPNQPKEGNSYE